MSTATLVGSDLIIDGTRANDVIEVLANLEPTHNLQDGAIELEVAAKGTVGSTDSRRFEAADIFVGPMKSMPIDDPGGAAVAGKVILPAPYATVVANGQEIGRFDLSTFESVKIYGHDGDDRLSVTDALHTLIYLDGGNGNDTLFIEPDKTPSEDPSKWFRPPTTTSVMLGGDGDDLLVGSNGVDMLIGGFGNDVALGYGGDDLLIGGATLADGNTKTLFSLLSTWNSEDDYMDRVDNFRTAVGELIPYDTDATFVSYDDSTDVLEGGEGQDWFFTGDRAELPDLSKDEIVDW